VKSVARSLYENSQAPRLRACLYRRIWRPDSLFTFNLALQKLIPYDRQLFHQGL